MTYGFRCRQFPALGSHHGGGGGGGGGGGCMLAGLVLNIDQEVHRVPPCL